MTSISRTLLTVLASFTIAACGGGGDPDSAVVVADPPSNAQGSELANDENVVEMAKSVHGSIGSAQVVRSRYSNQSGNGSGSGVRTKGSSTKGTTACRVSGDYLFSETGTSATLTFRNCDDGIGIVLDGAMSITKLEETGKHTDRHYRVVLQMDFVDFTERNLSTGEVQKTDAQARIAIEANGSRMTTDFSITVNGATTKMSFDCNRAGTICSVRNFSGDAKVVADNKEMNVAYEVQGEYQGPRQPGVVKIFPYEDRTTYIESVATADTVELQVYRNGSLEKTVQTSWETIESPEKQVQ